MTAPLSGELESDGESSRPAAPMTPAVVRVQSRRRETPDTFTIALEPASTQRRPNTSLPFRPGQFNMLYVFGVGEVPISISGDAARPDSLVHTIRAVGPVTNALAKLRRGDQLGVRGPFGSSWPIDLAAGHDLLIVSGGIGLAPLRPVLYQLIRHREKFGRVTLLYGARMPADLLYAKQLETWRRRHDIGVLVAVERADASWRGQVGVVTALFGQAHFESAKAIGLMCGPEIMMRFAMREFERRGVSDDRLYVSLERNMQCAVGFCGRCQFGPNFVCMNGPVFRFDRIKPFFNVREA